MRGLGAQGVGGEAFILTDGTPGYTCKEYFGRLAEAAGVALRAPAMPRALALGFAKAVSAAARAAGKTPPFTPSAVRYVSRRSCSFRIDKARTRLGYAPTRDLDAGMAERAEAFARSAA